MEDFLSERALMLDKFNLNSRDKNDNELLSAQKPKDKEGEINESNVRAEIDALLAEAQVGENFKGLTNVKYKTPSV